MDAMLQARGLANGDLALLMYAQHMMKTARSDAARQLFEAFVQRERERLETGGGTQEVGGRLRKEEVR